MAEQLQAKVRIGFDQVEFVSDLGVKCGIIFFQAIHEVQRRDRVGLKCRRMKGRFRGPIPVIVQRLACRERAEGDVMIDERLVEYDDIGGYRRLQIADLA